MHHLLNRVGYGWKEWFLPSSAVSQCEIGCVVRAFHLSVGQSSTGDVCLFHPEPGASDLTKKRKKTAVLTNSLTRG